jgi:hypothetical protein
MKRIIHMGTHIRKTFPLGLFAVFSDKLLKGNILFPFDACPRDPRRGTLPFANPCVFPKDFTKGNHFHCVLDGLFPLSVPLRK